MLNKEQNVQVCDATYDAMKYNCLANKTAYIFCMPADSICFINFKPGPPKTTTMAQPNEFADLKLGNPVLRALANAGITNLKQLSKKTRKEFLSLHGVGKSAIPKIEQAFAARGLSFAPEK